MNKKSQPHPPHDPRPRLRISHRLNPWPFWHSVGRPAPGWPGWLPRAGPADAEQLGRWPAALAEQLLEDPARRQRLQKLLSEGVVLSTDYSGAGGMEAIWLWVADPLPPAVR